MNTSLLRRLTTAGWIVVITSALVASPDKESLMQFNNKDLRHTLENSTWKATFHGGLPIRIEDRSNQSVILDISVSDWARPLALLGPDKPVDLSKAQATASAQDGAIKATYTWDNGTQWSIEWELPPGTADLAVRCSAVCAEPVDEARTLLLGCRLTDHTLVWIHGYGVGHTANPPWNSTFLGDPLAGGSPMTFVHPLVGLFQGKTGGWFIEGREDRIGPACLMVQGRGQTVDMGFVRRFPTPTRTVELYEVRLRPYRQHWADAVDPYVDWLEKSAGFIALDKLPASQAWIEDIKTQAYIGVGDFDGLDRLAQRVNPAQTFVGRQAEYRFYDFDVGFPDYRVTDKGKKWFAHARKLGFHVGAHFNSKSVSVMFPELVEKFKPGMRVIGKDEEGNPTYEHIYSGPNTLYRVSAGLKSWREHLIKEIGQAVEAGVDVVYLDEAMSPNGAFMVDGVDGFQGLLLLMKEVLEAYPHVAIQSEQFNTLTAKYSKIALSQMPLGHPLSGYIFRRFIKIVPEGVMYSPTDSQLMDAFDVWGFMLPGADTAREESWMRIAEAFHRYDLVPDVRMNRQAVTVFGHHYTHGQTPVLNNAVPETSMKLFGFRGSNNVTAFFEIHPRKRGLVLYEPEKEPRWVGARYTNIRSYPAQPVQAADTSCTPDMVHDHERNRTTAKQLHCEGPGIPEFYGFREQIKDWLIYDGQTLLGLNPDMTYWFDTTQTPSPTRFHVFKVPEDYRGIIDGDYRTMSQTTGPDDRYFYVRFTGNGQIGVYVPPEYDAWLNGHKLQPDPSSRKAFATVHASFDKEQKLGYVIGQDTDIGDQTITSKGPAILIAFRRTDTPLVGPWPELPWYGSPDSLKWITGNNPAQPVQAADTSCTPDMVHDHERNRSTVKRLHRANGFLMNVGAVGRIIGTFPTGRIRMTGSYQVTPAGTGPPGDGVVRINGTEVLRIPHGGPDCPVTPFDVDISSYAGTHVFVEFFSDGWVRGRSASWNNPRFVAE